MRFRLARPASILRAACAARGATSIGEPRAARAAGRGAALEPARRAGVRAGACSGASRPRARIDRNMQTVLGAAEPAVARRPRTGSLTKLEVIQGNLVNLNLKVDRLAGGAAPRAAAPAAKPRARADAAAEDAGRPVALTARARVAGAVGSAAVREEVARRRRRGRRASPGRRPGAAPRPSTGAPAVREERRQRRLLARGERAQVRAAAPRGARRARRARRRAAAARRAAAVRAPRGSTRFTTTPLHARARRRRARATSSLGLRRRGAARAR